MNVTTTIKHPGNLKPTRITVHGDWTTAQIQGAANKAYALGGRYSVDAVQRMLDLETMLTANRNA